MTHRILNFNVNSMIFIINEEHQTLHISYNQLSCTTDIPFFFISKGIFLCLDVDILLYFILFYLFIFCLETFEGIYPWKKIFLLCQYSKSYGYFKCVISGGLIKSFFGRKKNQLPCVFVNFCSISGWCWAFNRTSPRQSWE